MARGRKTALTVHLTTDERQTLQSWQHSWTIRAPRARRGRILLLLADGMPLIEIAAMVGMTRRGIYKWVERFMHDGVVGLVDTRDRHSR